MGYHTLLATVCSSESIAGVVYGHWEKESRARIRLVLVSVAVSMLCTIASKLISSMDCTGKFVRLAVVNFPAVISAFPTYYWWHYDCEEWLFRRIRLCMLCSVLSSLFFIQSSTKSSVLTFSMCAVLVLGVVPGVLSAGIEWDTTGRLLPLSPSDEVHPHWAPLLYYFVWDSAYVILSAAISHAVAGHSYSQPVPSAPFAAQSITKPNALMWLVLPVRPACVDFHACSFFFLGCDAVPLCVCHSHAEICGQIFLEIGTGADQRSILQPECTKHTRVGFANALVYKHAPAPWD